MKKQPLIVLLTDFSDASYEAFAPAAELARRIGGRIALFHVIEQLAAIPHGAPLAPRVAIPPDNAPELIQKAREDLVAAELRLGADVPVEVDATIAVEVHDEVVRYAQEHEADFIALASHGRTGFRRALMGSVAESVLRHSTVPVIAFPLDPSQADED